MKSNAREGPPENIQSISGPLHEMEQILHHAITAAAIHAKDSSHLHERP